MSAIVTDQFRILNANNFIDSVKDSNNSDYVFLSLPNPNTVGFGRSTTWDSSVPNPIDSFNYLNHVSDTILFGKRVTINDVRRLIRRVNWTQGTIYEMYRHDYSVYNQSPQTNSTRLYDSNYYVINKDYRVYVCIDNGSSAAKPTGNFSQDEPTFIDLEPSRAGESGDGYIWKYLFTVSPSDIIKFDSIEYIPVPNDWDTSTDSQIQAIRENGDSTINDNQIKKVYIANQGSGYNTTNAELDIIGDGTGGKVIVNVSAGKIVEATVSSGGKNYTYGRVDLSTINSGATTFANLIPIIPPSKGHGYDLYKELGTDKVLIYCRFDGSSKDFPFDTKFAQIGIIKNPTRIGSATSIFGESQFSNLNALKVLSASNISDAIPGTKIFQSFSGVGTAVGYIASYDNETKVLKYFTDRSLYFNPSAPYDQKDSFNIVNEATAVSFNPSGGTITAENAFNCTLDPNFSGITTTVSSTKIVNLATQFTNGVATPEINKRTGTIIYLDNRPLVSRNPQQKEDIKIILEF
jgi:translation elongation factor P/translation initiation factor 5A